MAKRKAATKAAVGNKTANQSVEPMVVALAAQLGSFLGRLQKKADGLLGNAEMRRQVSQIRDGAEDLLKQVNKAGVSMRTAVEQSAPAKKLKAAASAASATSAKASKGRSGGVVDASGKRHRKPPPQELFDPRLGEPMGKQMGQKNLKRRGRG